MGIRERKKRERERRRRQILVAAQMVFSANGFKNTTMDDIAKEAELSIGTVYFYYKNKNELYATLTLRILRLFITRLEHINPEKYSEPIQMINALVKAMYDVYDLDPRITILLLYLQSSETLNNMSPQFISEFKELYCDSRKLITKIIEAAIKKARVKERNPVILADIIWALFLGVLLREESNKIINVGKYYPRQTIAVAVDIFARGLQLQDKRTMNEKEDINAETKTPVDLILNRLTVDAEKVGTRAQKASDVLPSELDTAIAATPMELSARKIG